MQEDNHTEFKSSYSDAVTESLVAFANAKGGKVLIGIDNEGNPAKGFSYGPESIQNWLNEIKNKTQPSIIPDAEVLLIQGKDVISLSIREFPVKPVAFRGRYFKRVNNSNHQLSVVEIADLSLQSLQISWDSYEAHGKTINDIDLQKVEKFVRKVNDAGRFLLEGELLANLEKLKFIKGGKITNAAWLLFGKESTGYNIHLGRFKTPTLIIDDKMFNGTLFDMVDEIMRYLISWLKVAFEIKGMPTQRTEIFEYPLPALREIVLNALIHRDYLSPVDLQIKIFDQEITFFNPGKLYGDLTVEDLKRDSYQALARNKLIAEAFYLTGDIEKYGSGFLRIRKELKSYPSMNFVFNEVPTGFLITLNYTRQKISTDGGVNGGVNGGINGGVNKNENDLLELIRMNPGNKIQFFTSELNISKRKIERWLQRLKLEHQIEYRGAAKTGGYFITSGQ